MRLTRSFVLAAVLTLLAAAAAYAVPVDPNGTFIDDNGGVHEGSIEAIYEAGITKGCNPPANDRFCPAEPVTRAQMASFLTRAYSLPDGPDAFVDDAGNVHEVAINAIAAAGVTKGCNPPDNDRFCPAESVTRAQMASFLARAMDLVVGDAPNAFIDDEGNVHEDAINAIAAAGITKGCNPPDNDEYCPAEPVTRAQMATFLMRARGLDPLPPPSVDDAYVLAIYLMSPQDADGGPYLVTTARYLEGPAPTDAAALADDALDQLLLGPSPDEVAQSPSFSTSIPDGSERVAPVTVASGVAIVDLSGEFDDGGGTFSMTSRLAMLTFTATAIEGIDEVDLYLDGVDIDVFSGEGLDISDGLTRSDFLPTITDVIGSGLVPELFVERPAWFEFVESPIDVSGIGRAFEGDFNWELYDREGLLLASGHSMVGGGPEYGPMSFTASYDVAERQIGSLIVWWDSPEDGGGRVGLRETAMWLMP